MSTVRKGLFCLALLAACSAYGQVDRMPSPPPEWAAYWEKAKAADHIDDPELRCRNYPDLPGNHWNPKGDALCALLRKPALTLEEIDERLRLPGGSTALDTLYQELLDQHFTSGAQREQIYVAFEVFDDSDLARKIADRWVGVAPGSAFSRLASGTQYMQAAWKARGGKFANKTSSEQIANMQTMVSRAAVDLAQALRTNPRLFPACEGMMQVGQLASDRMAEAALSACLKADPDSYFVVRRWMFTVQPKWGGSLAKMRKVEEYAAKRVRGNPLLGRLASQVAGYSAWNSAQDTSWKNSLPDFEAAMAVAPDPAFLRYAGLGAQEEKNNWKALGLLSQSIRFDPTEPESYLARGRSRLVLGDFSGGVRDGEKALQIEPTNGEYAFLVGEGHKYLHHTELARAAYRIARDDPATRPRGFERWCTSFLFNAADLAEADACTRDLVAEYTESGEAWRMRMWVLERTKSPELAGATRQFLRYADMTNAAHRMAADKLRPVRPLE